MSDGFVAYILLFSDLSKLINLTIATRVSKEYRRLTRKIYRNMKKGVVKVKRIVMRKRR